MVATLSLHMKSLGVTKHVGYSVVFCECLLFLYAMQGGVCRSKLLELLSFNESYWEAL